MDAPPAARGSTTTLLYALPETIERSVRACDLEVPKSSAPATSNLLGNGLPISMPATGTRFGFVCPPPGLNHRTSEAEGSGRFLHGQHKSPGLYGPRLPDRPASGTQLVGCLLGESSKVRQLTHYPSIFRRPAHHEADGQNSPVSVAGGSDNKLNISKGAKEPTPSSADLDQICTAADTITNLCAARSPRILSRETVPQRQMWLKLSLSIPEDVIK